MQVSFLCVLFYKRGKKVNRQQHKRRSSLWMGLWWRSPQKNLQKRNRPIVGQKAVVRKDGNLQKSSSGIGKSKRSLKWRTAEAYRQKIYKRNTWWSIIHFVTCRTERQGVWRDCKTKWSRERAESRKIPSNHRWIRYRAGFKAKDSLWAGGIDKICLLWIEKADWWRSFY